MQPGDRLGERFELELRAGSGAMSEVFRARDQATGEAVAVKVLLERRAPDHPRFVREAEVLAELSHPGIVRYVAHGVAPSGQPYLAMEWLEGEDLSTRLGRGRLSVDEAIRLGLQAAHALAAAHARGVVHRDLKPSNLFLLGWEVGQVKLLDFGVAYRSDVTPALKTGTVVGTPGYMAPEQVRSEGDVDARADVFALGCVLFECSTGTPLFTGEHFMAILAKILFQEAPRLGEQAPGIPPSLDALCARMLAKDREERPRDGAAVAEALAALGLSLARMPVGDASPPVSSPSSALTGSERRILSVVFLGRDPVSHQGAPAPHRVEIASAAEAHGGRLELLADGSAIVRIAGATRIATDQAAQAARCALALHALCRDRPMALATGRAEVTGKLADGDAIDRAARMLSGLAKEEGRPPLIAIDEVTAGLLDARFEVVEGAAGLELLGEHALAAGARTLLGKATACVGRDAELSILEAFLTECVDEQVARAVLVTAPAGMGKSRLEYELTRRVRQRGEPFSIWSGRIDSLRAGSAFGLLGQVLRSALGVHDGEPLSARRQKVEARVAEHVAPSEQRQVAEFLGELVGAPFSDEQSIPLRAARQDAQLMGDQMRRAWVDFLRAESAAQPVLLVLEDLHWGDLPTVRFIDAALRDVADQPFLVLALARPEVHQLFPKLWAQRGLQEIHLKQLSRRASERLVRQVLGDGVGQETMEHIVTQAEGNAFYLEELIRAVADGKGAALPETVLAMVEARLAGLPSEARRVLRAVSVFGEVFWQGGVTELLGGAIQSAQASEWLLQLLSWEVLEQRLESRFPGESEFAFRHALLREGAYAMLTEEDRTLGHRLAGEWLLQHGESEPIVLAEHFERGGEPARAGSFYLRAAEQAHRGGDTDSAIAHAKRGLACSVPPELRVALLGLLCLAYVYRPGALIEGASHIEEVMRLAKPGTAPWAQAVSAKLVRAMHLDEHDAFMATLNLVKGIEPLPEALVPIAAAFANGIFVLDQWGQLKEARSLLDLFAPIASAVAEREPSAAGFLSAIQAMRAAYADEDPWSGLKWAAVTVALYKEANHPRGIVVGEVFSGMNLWFLGALVSAERELRGNTNPDDQAGTIHRALSLIGVLSDRGELDEALELATGLVEHAQTRRHRLDEGRGRWALAEVLRRRGTLDAAEREARAAIELLSTVPLDQSAATVALAAVLLAQGRAREALATAEEALARSASMRACGMFRGALLRLVHAEALLAVGDRDGARAAISAARARVVVNAEKIGDPAYRKSFLETVPENARTLALARAWIGEGDDTPVA